MKDCLEEDCMVDLLLQEPPGSHRGYHGLGIMHLREGRKRTLHIFDGEVGG